MEKISRSELAAKTSVMGMLSKILTIAVAFVVRYVFIRALGEEFLGLEGVIKDCISLLMLTDLGIDSAMTFRLYAVVNDGDQNTINAYLTFYKKMYRVIEVIIAILGTIVLFALPQIINEISVPWTTIYAAYFLQIISVEASYFAAYKRCFLNANQRKDVQIKTDTVISLVASIAKIVMLIGKNYLAYIAVTIIQNLLANIYLSHYVKQHYPKIETVKEVDKSVKIDLFRDTKNILWNKLVGFVYSSTDSVLISTIISTVAVAKLVNYKLIFSSLTLLLSGFTSPLATIVGNYLNSKNRSQDTFSVQMQYAFVRFVFAAVCVVPCICLSGQFIVIYAGNESWQLPLIDVVLLSADFYIGCLYGSLGDYSAGMGLFNQQKYVSTISAIANLTVSIVLLRLLGITGALIGTVVGQLVLWTGNWVIIEKRLWRSGSERNRYWVRQAEYVILTVICTIVLSRFTRSLWMDNLLVDFVLKGVVIVATLVVVIIIVFRRSKEFGFFYKLFRDQMNKMISKL